MEVINKLYQRRGLGGRGSFPALLSTLGGRHLYLAGLVNGTQEEDYDKRRRGAGPEGIQMHCTISGRGEGRFEFSIQNMSEAEAVGLI